VPWIRGILLEKIDLSDFSKTIDKVFTRKTIATVNDHMVHIAKIMGSYSFHVHDGDEFFLCLEGRFITEKEDGETIDVGPGECIVIKKGERHRTRSLEGALVIAFEKANIETDFS
jgi:mannose-6-phosphate isomerase-like protein (cupin superfamily)